MDIKEGTLLAILKKLKKVELLAYLEAAFQEMDEIQRRMVFMDLYNETVYKSSSPEDLYARIEAFYQSSIRGDYYASFAINSKNFMHVPAETDEWFSEVGYYLDEAAKLVDKKAFAVANQCFEKLYAIIDEMEEGDVVFADEYGTWMIAAQSDYASAYIKSLSQAEDAETFAEKVLPLLVRDSYESLSGKIYAKVKNAASASQFKKVQEEIKLQNIRVK